MDERHARELYEKLISKVRSYNSHVHSKIIEKAILFSAKMHAGKKRDSGEEYFMHCYEIGKILADLKLDSHTIAAGLLHDALECDVKPETLEKEFDRETLDLVQSVTKLKQINKKLSLDEERERRAENLRKIVLATSKDIRVILIKLADRLHNMRTLKYLSPEKRKVISEETIDIFAQIADKLGMYNMKAELEDLAFRFLEPKKYLELKEKVAKKRDQREREVIKIIEFVKQKIKENGVSAEINGRAKHFYSIYKKLVRDNKTFDQIYDLIAIRIITNNTDQCYKALGVIHKLWPHMPDRLKDYIAVPKANGYQSIQTTVIIGEGRALEVQIRDKEMHRQAEEGIAAHWRYKGDEQDKKFDRQIEWLKQFLEWKRNSSDASEFIESLKVDLFQREIFVFTPKGDIISLPEDATPVDFAYAVHTDVGNHCNQAKINNNIVPLDYKLAPGDIVEIITTKNASPSRSWLSFVKSNNTVVKIKHALGIALDNNPKKREVQQKILKERSSRYDKTFAFRQGNIYFEGRSANLKIPKCCNPKIGDKIRAFKSKDGKIVVHKANCINLYSYDADREIKAEVTETKKKTVLLKISVTDRAGLLSDILHVIAQQHQDIRQINTKFGKNDNAVITLELLVNEDFDSSAIISIMLRIKSVQKVNVE